MGISIPPDTWKDVILTELILCHIYQKEHETNPKKALNDVINWHMQVALDPLVSEDARKLIEYGADKCSCRES